MTHKADKDHCCPQLDTTRWDNKTQVWKDKPFIKGSVPTFFHIPYPPMIGKLVGRMWEAAKNAGAAPEIKDFLLLAYDPSAFRSEFYMTVTKEVPGQDNVKLSGSFFTKVFDGAYSMAPAWMKQTEKELKEQGKTASKYYFYYTYCPKCAKDYGHNYCIVFAQTE